MRSSTLPAASPLSTRGYAMPAFFSGYRSDIDGARRAPPQDGGASFGVEERGHEPGKTQPLAVEVEQVEGDELPVGVRLDPFEA